ncbi:MAG TPA: hypothetical protein VG838_11435 [Opitutaceae bacterium]|nr:hypothetical protein [Opitutaceae bacterium]
MNLRLFLVLAAALGGSAACAAVAAGSEPSAGSAGNITEAQVSAATAASAFAALQGLAGKPSAADAILHDPNLERELVDSFVKQLGAGDDRLSGLINDLHLQPKVYQVKGAKDESVLGLEYAYERSVAGRVINPDSRDPYGLSLNFHAKGSVTADAAKNPNNFLDTGITFNLFQAVGGVEPMIFTEAAAAAMNEAVIAATKIPTTGAEREKDPRWAALARAWSTHIRPQALWFVAGSGTLESDQKFANKQWTYGGQAGVSVRDWRDSSLATWLNLPDYPFAVLRALTDQTESFRPSGHAFPTFIGGLDLVDPKDNKDRLAADPDPGAYQRVRGEIAFKTKAALLFGKPVWLAASYRVFEETGASAAIKAAKLDKFEYFSAELDFVNDFSVTYSSGKLPLDRKSDQVFSLGYKLTL